MSIYFRAVKHKDLGEAQLDKIVALKEQYWTYSLESQKKWITEHFSPNDTHILAYENSNLVSYASLTRQECFIDVNKIHFLGLGNVCVDCKFRGHGYGLKIVKQANYLILKHKEAGLLLCHKPLISFYQKSGWHQIHASTVNINQHPFYESIMGFNTSLSTVVYAEFPVNF